MNTEHSDLASCPFCGNTKMRLKTRSCIILGNITMVRCDNCNCEGPTGRHVGMAVKLWNARATHKDGEGQ